MLDEIFLDGVRYVSAKDAAESVGLSRDYVARLCKKGDVRGRLFGKSWYVDETSLKEFSLKKEYEKTHRYQELSESRATEYHASNPHARLVHQRGASESFRAFERSAFPDKQKSVSFDVKKALLHSMHSHVLRATAASGPMRHAPLYATTPMVDFMHRAIALITAFMLTFGTYAFVDPSYAHAAYASIARAVERLADINVRGGFERAGSFAIGSIADPRATFAAASFSVGAPTLLEQVAMRVNRTVDDAIFSIMFPQLEDGSAPQTLRANARVSVSVGSVSSDTASPVFASAGAGSSVAVAASANVVPRSVPSSGSSAANTVERVVEIRTFAGAGISEDAFNTRLGELESRLNSRIWSSSVANTTQTYQSYVAAGGLGRIEDLDNVRLDDPTIVGGTIADASLSNITFSGALTAENLTATNATTTNLYVSGSLSTASSSLTNLSFTYATGTNLYLTGGLGIGTATTTSGVLETSGNAYIGGNLTVLGNSVTLGVSTSSSLAINSAINSNLVPSANATFDLGSASYYWDDAFIDTLTVNNISAASTTIGGTQSSTFTFNSDNATADTEDATLIFYRGTVVPNALLTWNSTLDRFEFNQPLHIESGAGSTTIPTLSLAGVAGQTGDILKIASSSGSTLLSITGEGKLGIGTTSPSASLAVASPIFVGGTGVTATSTFEGNVNVQGLLKVGTSSTYISNSDISTVGSLTITNGTSTNFAVTGTASTSALVASNSFTFSNVTGFLKATAGAVATSLINLASDVTGILPVANGGTGWSAIASNTLLTGNGSGALATTTIGNGLTLSGSTLATSFGTTTENTWTALQQFSAGASTTRFSIFNNAYFGGTGTTTVSSTGAITTPANLTLSGSSANILLGSNYLSGDGGDEGVYVGSTGNVGIGTASPGSKLTVGSTNGLSNKLLVVSDRTTPETAAGANGILVDINGGGGIYMTGDAGVVEGKYEAYSGALGVGTMSAHPLEFFSNNNEVARFDTSGRFGIGTTSPYAKLSVAGEAVAQNFTATSTTAISTFPLLTSTTATTTNLAITGITSSLLKTNSLGQLVAATAGTDYQTFSYLFPSNATSTLLSFNGGLTGYASSTIGDGTQAGGLTISGGATTTGNAYFAGNVGFGTAAPTTKWSFDTGGSEQYISLKNGATTYAQLGNADGTSGYLGLYNGGTQTFALDSRPGNASWINSSGLQIGSNQGSTIDYKLDVIGSGVDGYFGVGTNVGTGNIFNVSSSGNVGIGTTSPYRQLSVGNNAAFGGDVLAAYFTATSTTASTFPYASTTAISGTTAQFSTASSTNLVVSGVQSALHLAGTDGTVSAYAGSSCTNQFIRSINGAGVATCASVNLSSDVTGTLDISGSTNLAATYPVLLTGDTLSLAFGTTTANTWSALQQFSGGASTTNFSAFNNAYFGATATSSFSSTGALTLVNALTLSGTTANIALGSNYLSGDGGDEGIYVDSTGNVGVGTASVSVPLEVSGSSTGGNGTLRVTNTNSGTRETLVLRRSSGTGGTSFILDDTAGTSGRKFEFFATDSGNSEGAGKLIIFNNDVANVTVDSAGNFGVGTTSPYAKLSVAGQTVAQYFTATSSTASTFPYASTTALTTTGLFVNATTTYGATLGVKNDFYGANGHWQQGIFNYSGTNMMEFGVNGSADAFTFGYGTPGSLTRALTIQGSGNVGIGTTSPASTLSVSGTGYFTSGIGIGVSVPGAKLQIKNTVGSPTYFDYSGDNRNYIRGTTYFDSGDTVYVAGNVGIGTSSPMKSLTVMSGASNSQQILLGNQGQNSYLWALGREGVSTGRFGIYQTQDGSTYTEPLSILTSGNVGIGSTTPNATLVVSGDMFLDGSSRYLNFGTSAQGTNGYGFRDNAGTLQLKNSGGSWTNIPTSASGATGSTGQLPYFSATDTLTGTSSIYLATSGNVGIGTSTPRYALGVRGTLELEATNPIFYQTAWGAAADTGRWQTNAVNDGSWQIQALNDVGDGASSAMVINRSGTTISKVYFPNGNIGIGTTSPTAKLAVLASGGGGIDVSSDSFSRIRFYETSSGVHMGTGADNNGMFFYDYKNSAERVRIGTTGLFGIGTTTPWAQLSVNPNGVSGPSFAIGSSTATHFLVTNGGNVGIGDTSPSALLTVGSGDLFQVSSAGNVGVKTTANTSYALDVNGNSNTYYARFSDFTSATLTIGNDGAGNIRLGTDGAQDIAFYPGGSEKVRITDGGLFGIGTTSPFRKLSITDAVSTAQAAIAYDSTRYTDLLTNSVGDLVINPQGDDAFLNDDNLWVCTGGSCPSGTPTGTGNLIVENKVGIGTTTPDVPLSVVGSSGQVIEAYGSSVPSIAVGETKSDRWNIGQWTSNSDKLYFERNGSGDIKMIIDTSGNVGIGTTTPTKQLSISSLLYVGAGGASGMGTATSTFQGDIKILGKLDVSTIDPVYTIDGVKYATYGHSTVGIKEETLQTVRLDSFDEARGKYVREIRFARERIGSDIWLFYQVTDFGADWQSLVVSLTPAFDGAVFYEKDAATGTLRIVSDQPGEVSMRLAANRYDFSKWPNLRSDQEDREYLGHEIPSKQ